MSKTVKCPKWGCDGVGIPVDTKKKFSFGKALSHFLFTYHLIALNLLDMYGKVACLIVQKLMI